MLEGLEISEVTYSEVVKMSNDFRINSEFFSKQFLQLKSGRKLAFLPLKQLAKVADGDHSKFPDNQLEEVRYLQARDITNNFLEITSDVFVSNEYFSKNQRSIITEETILLSIMGTVGDIAITPKGFQACMCNRALAIIRDIKTISPQFLFAFLITKQAANLIDRLKNGGVQQRINLDVLGELEIPNFGNELQDKVTQLVLLAQETRQQAKQKYAQAEKTLLEAVGLADFKPSTQNTNIKTFAQSFGTSGRLDAEYYQPKYDYLEKVFNQFERIKLQDLVNYPISSGITPKAGGDDYTDAGNGVPFVRAVDLQNGLVSIDNFNYIKPEIHTGVLKRTQLKQNDFLFSIAGTVGRCAIFEHTFEANINQAVAILRFNDARVNPYYLMMFFNSSIGKEFVGKYSRQGLQTNLNLSEVGDLSIPIIDLATQTNISQLVQQSFTLKAQSEHLLSVAKRAVEIVIEQDEAAAMHFIENSQ